jgi:hypothetical protein
MVLIDILQYNVCNDTEPKMTTMTTFTLCEFYLKLKSNVMSMRTEFT